MYNSKTKATMKAATTRSIMTGTIGHQELMKIQSVTVEPEAASGDMGEARRPLACVLTRLAGRSGLIGPITKLRSWPRP